MAAQFTCMSIVSNVSGCYADRNFLMELAAAVVWKSSEKKAWHQLSILYYDNVVDFLPIAKLIRLLYKFLPPLRSCTVLLA